MQNSLASPGLRRFKGTFLGDKPFYRTVLAIILPIIVQHTVSNFVSLLDNVMVGAVGTLHMSGVAISNQLLFVFNLLYSARSRGASTARSSSRAGLEGFRRHSALS
jgi:Na+-driven multidrug efflux pump